MRIKYLQLAALPLTALLLFSCSISDINLKNSHQIIVHADQDIKYDFVVGDKIEINPITIEEFDFDGFYLDDRFTTLFEMTEMPNHDIELYPKLVEVEYNIQFNGNGGETIDNICETKDWISKNSLPKPEKIGHTFDKWYFDEELTKEFTISSINKNTRNITLYAKYNINPYTINVHIGEDNYRYQFDYDETINLPTINEEGFFFKGFYLEKELKTLFTLEKMPNYDIDLYPKLTHYNKLTILCSNNNYGNLIGKTTQYLEDGTISEPIIAVPKLGYRFKGWSNDSHEASQSFTIHEDTIIYAYFYIDYLELPVMEVCTSGRSPITSKEDYIKYTVSVSNSNYNYCFDDIPGKIKGRGNSTWSMPKKPYKLKFDEKCDLFGNGAAKTWTLIANFLDPSMSRNYISLMLGSLVGCEYVSSVQFIDLYLNDEYCGVYLVCEQNEVDSERVNIDSSLADINTGYLVELDMRGESEGTEGIDWFYLNDFIYVVKSPDTENKNYSKEYTSYIRDYLINAKNALVNGNITEIDNLIDLNSFAKAYFIYELMKNAEVNNSSLYLNKAKDGKLKIGPIWDFDVSSSNYEYETEAYDELWIADDFWFENLVNQPYFVNLLCSLIKDSYVPIINEVNKLYSYLKNYSNSFNRNYLRWDVLGQQMWPTPPRLVALTTWEEQIDYLRNWVLKSLDFIYNNYIDASLEAFSVTYNTDDNCSINVYNTADISSPTIILSNAWSRSENTGELLDDGTGSAFFEVDVKEGYKIKSISVDNPGNYCELVTIDEGRHVYKIKGITGNIEVDVQTEEDNDSPIQVGYSITFVTDEFASIMVYPGKDYSVDGEVTNSTILTDMSGDGQINYKVILTSGREIDNMSVVGSYKNIKGPDDTGASNVYRITKVASDLIVTISTK